MIIKNACLNGEITDIDCENGVITAIGKAPRTDDVIDANCATVIPGLIDIHIHGAGGFDVMSGDLEQISRFLAKSGTTAFCPTTMTASKEELKAVTELSAETDGAQILGFHLEGPFIAKEKCGAQNAEEIRKADIDELKGYKNVKMITVAPETDGCIDFIKQAKDICSVSIGHTNCDFETAQAAFSAGANSLTHTFNAMPPMLNRNPGPVGAGMLSGAFAQLICDGKHVDKANVLMLYKTFGKDRVCLISDSIKPAGLPDGVYTCGGVEVTYKDGTATEPTGHLAGSTSTLFECVKKAVEFGIPFEDAVTMATKTPARAIGVKNKGEIAVGFDADMIILDESLNINKVIIKGKAV